MNSNTIRVRLDNETLQLIKLHKKNVGISINKFIKIAVNERIKKLEKLKLL